MMATRKGNGFKAAEDHVEDHFHAVGRAQGHGKRRRLLRHAAAKRERHQDDQQPFHEFPFARPLILTA